MRILGTVRCIQLAQKCAALLGGGIPEELGNPHHANLNSADNRGKMLNHITRRRKVFYTELIYVINKLQPFVVGEVLLLCRILLHGPLNASVTLRQSCTMNTMRISTFF